jgi:hypothetical protein
MDTLIDLDPGGLVGRGNLLPVLLVNVQKACVQNRQVRRQGEKIPRRITSTCGSWSELASTLGWGEGGLMGTRISGGIVKLLGRVDRRFGTPTMRAMFHLC